MDCLKTVREKNFVEAAKACQEHQQVMEDKKRAIIEAKGKAAVAKSKQKQLPLCSKSVRKRRQKSTL